MDVNAILNSKGREVATVSRDTGVATAIKIMKRKRIGAVVVLDNGERVIGVIAERGIVLGLAKHGAELLHLPVSELLSGDVMTCSPEDNIKAMMATMTARRTRHVPVVDNGVLCGIISIGDLVKNRIEEAELETRVLRDAYITHGAHPGS